MINQPGLFHRWVWIYLFLVKLVETQKGIFTFMQFLSKNIHLKHNQALCFYSISSGLSRSSKLPYSGSSSSSSPPNPPMFPIPPIPPGNPCIIDGSSPPNPLSPSSSSSSSSTHLDQSTWIYWFFSMLLVILGQKGLLAYFFPRTTRRWNPVLFHFDSPVSIASNNSNENWYFLLSLIPLN